MWGIIAVISSGHAYLTLFLRENKEWTGHEDLAARVENRADLEKWGFLPPSQNPKDIVLIAAYQFGGSSLSKAFRNLMPLDLVAQKR